MGSRKDQIKVRKMKKQILKLISLSCIISMLGNVPLALAANGEVLSFQEISETSGGLSSTLESSDYFGDDVGNIGDLDNDGITDLIIGAHQDDDGQTNGNRGAAYILFMNTDGTVKSEQKISDTEGNFTATLDNADYFGSGVAGIGDLDGDGIEDIAIGAKGDDDGGSGYGAIYICFMNTDGTVDSYQKISKTDGGFTGYTPYLNENFGESITLLGDLDNDEVDDLVVSAPNANGVNDKGSIYILFMNTDGTVKDNQKIAHGEGGLSEYLGNYDRFGYSIAGLGDLDGDGIEDVAAGIPRDDDGGNDHGAIIILFLNEDGTVNSEQKISDTEGNFTGTLDSGDNFGRGLANIGDLNNDGVIDLAVGADYDDDGTTNNGAVWILFMNDDGTVDSHQKISDTEGSFTASLDNGARLGMSIEGIGDIDEDGKEDIIVGASHSDDGGSDAGSIYILNLDGPAPTTNPVFPGWSLLLTGIMLFYFMDRYKGTFQFKPLLQSK